MNRLTGVGMGAATTARLKMLVSNPKRREIDIFKVDCIFVHNCAYYIWSSQPFENSYVDVVISNLLQKSVLSFFITRLVN